MRLLLGRLVQPGLPYMIWKRVKKMTSLFRVDRAQRRQKAVLVVERVQKIEQDMGAMDGKLDVIIVSMRKPSLPESEGKGVVEDWTKDILEADEAESQAAVVFVVTSVIIIGIVFVVSGTAT